jgi:hypothetical protein
LICNLDAGVECPERRNFSFDPIDRVLNDRGAYIAAALTITRAFLLSGEKVTCDPLGSYGDWSRFVREPLIWLGEVDPVKSQEQARANDPEASAARELFDAWEHRLGLDKAYKVSEIIANVTPSVNTPHNELYKVLSEHAGGRYLEVDPRRFGHWLKRIRGRVYQGRCIDIAQESTGHGNRWKLSKR